MRDEMKNPSPVGRRESPRMDLESADDGDKHTSNFRIMSLQEGFIGGIRDENDVLQVLMDT